MFRFDPAPLVRGLLGLLFPPDAGCRLCGSPYRPERDPGLCPSCIDRLPLVSGRLCSVCGRPLGIDGSFAGKPECPDCAGFENRCFSAVRSPMVYTGLARELVLDMKFHGAYGNAALLADLMCLMLRELGPLEAFDCLVPVPVHRDRLAERGYNQAELLARRMSETLGKPMVGCLVRHGSTAPQSLTPGDRRKGNVKGCFSLADPGSIALRRVLVVDDIYTTGATLNECSMVLAKGGASSVQCMCATVVLPDWKVQEGPGGTVVEP